MIRVNIALQPRPYDALIENGLLERAGDLVSAVFGLDARDSPSKLTRARGFIVTVAPVRRRWGKKLMDSLSRAGFAAQMLEMPDGERYKKLATVEKLSEQLSHLGADRSSIVIAFGGGVVRAPVQVHGKLSEIRHQGDGIFRGINAPFRATRQDERSSPARCSGVTRSTHRS